MKEMRSPSETAMLRAAKISLFCNVLLFVIKLTAILLVYSLALVTDFAITFVGLSVSGFLYYSVKLASRPSDFFHNYGYSKIENVCEAIEGVILIGIALAMSFQAVTHLVHPKELLQPWIGLLSSTINLTINFVGAHFIFKMARQSHSPAVHAEGVHYRLEGFISSAIAGSFAISIVLRFIGDFGIGPYVDPMATLLVSSLILVPSFNLAKGAFFGLLDASIEEGKTIEVLKHLARHSEEYCEFRNVKSRRAGSRSFIELELVLPEGMDIGTADRIATVLSDDIQASVPHAEVSVRVRPCEGDCIFRREAKTCPYCGL